MADAIRTLTADEARAYRPDVVIVGTGAGSLSIAGELGRRGIRTLLIEGGPVWGKIPARHRRNEVEPYDDYVDELFARLLPHGNAAKPWPGLPGGKGVHGVGGMMTYWAHMVPRPDLVCEWGGPLPRDTIADYLRRAEEVIWATQDLFADSPRQAWIGEKLARDFGDGFARRAEVAGRRSADGRIEWAGGDTLVAGAAESCAILPRAVARRVNVAGGKARSLRVACLDDEVELMIEADVIVVGGGVVGTPQLLVASGVNDLPALGGYLTDHLNIISRVRLRDDCPTHQPGDERVLLRVSPSPDRDFQIGILDIPSRAHIGTLSGAEGLNTTDIGAFVGTDPVAENRLSFNVRDLDSLGLPAVSADIRLTLQDHARVKSAFAAEYDIACAIGEPWQGMTPILQPFGSSLHMMGTYRMGSAQDTSVTDDECRVWGTDNLYLAGNGLIGWKNHCNPTLTTIALGLVAADAIAAG